jgi:hypothetical protein
MAVNYRGKKFYNIGPWMQYNQKVNNHMLTEKGEKAYEWYHNIRYCYTRYKDNNNNTFSIMLFSTMTLNNVTLSIMTQQKNLNVTLSIKNNAIG